MQSIRECKSVTIKDIDYHARSFSFNNEPFYRIDDVTSYSYCAYSSMCMCVCWEGGAVAMKLQVSNSCHPDKLTCSPSCFWVFLIKSVFLLYLDLIPVFHLKSPKISRDCSHGFWTSRDRLGALPHFPALPQSSTGISEPPESRRKGLLCSSCTFRKRPKLHGHVNIKEQLCLTYNNGK